MSSFQSAGCSLMNSCIMRMQCSSLTITPSDDSIVMDENRADRNASFGETEFRLRNGGLEECPHALTPMVAARAADDRTAPASAHGDRCVRRAAGNSPTALH